MNVKEDPELSVLATVEATTRRTQAEAALMDATANKVAAERRLADALYAARHPWLVRLHECEQSI